ncbi:hypothetical protein MRX96_056114 [Rhipicephalus microplus]
MHTGSISTDPTTLYVTPGVVSWASHFAPDITAIVVRTKLLATHTHVQNVPHAKEARTPRGWTVPHGNRIGSSLGTFVLMRVGMERHQTMPERSRADSGVMRVGKVKKSTPL